MAGHDDKYLEFNALYVLGALDGDELREFDAHLKSNCALCRAEVSYLTAAAATLPMGLPQLSLSPDLKERVLFNARLAQVTKAYVEAAPEAAPADAPRRVEEHAAERTVRSRRLPWLSFGLAFAVIVMLVGFTIYVNSLFRTINNQNQYIYAQQTQITKLFGELELRDAILKVLQSRRIEIVSMDGLGVNPVGYGTVLWDPDKKVAILHVSNLPAVPKDKEYQLWVIKNQKPASAGIFAVTNDREKENFFKVQPLDVTDRKEIDAFAVTLEAKGGVPQPTGEMYLLGKASTP